MEGKWRQCSENSPRISDQIYGLRKCMLNLSFRYLQFNILCSLFTVSQHEHENIFPISVLDTNGLLSLNFYLLLVNMSRK